jgi:dipeptidyl aminopeptidase/acylaminoacyl peptidase
MINKYIYTSLIFMASTIACKAQANFDIETLWQLGRVNPMGLSSDGSAIQYSVSIPNVAENKSKTQYFQVPIIGGTATSIQAPNNAWANYDNAQVNSAGNKIAFTQEVAVEKIIASDKYADLPKSNAYIFTTLNNRHWDEWEDGKYSHLFVADIANGKVINAKDIMEGQPYDCPQKPHGGTEDFVWSKDGKSLIYICKKLAGTAYAISTNTDVYCYDIATSITTNLSAGMPGYDQNPSFNNDGSKLAWLSMARDGYESDKQDLLIMDWATKAITNITKTRDETISDYVWSNAGNTIYFTAPYRGTKQLYEIFTGSVINMPRNAKAQRKMPPVKPFAIRQITNGQHDVNAIAAEDNGNLYVTVSTMLAANEIYKVDKVNGVLQQLSQVNTTTYNKLAPCTVKPRTCKATDGSNLFSWIVYPPNFDPNKKYPTLLYCQGGPQGSISQFYSFRWNFQLMASKGYIVIVPNRRGCQGWGVKWNEDISKNWGGQAIDDYLSAFDNMAQESYVDKNRCAAVGASYGGYSVFMLAGKHNKRFKSFIAHDGLFDLRSWYGTTEEIFFANWDIGGPYWNENNASYKQHNPINFVNKWDTPIMIVQGGKDYRVGIEQGLQAFQTAQLMGIKSKLLYLPDENHWVLRAQNAQVWQREFYSWLAETLP